MRYQLYVLKTILKEIKMIFLKIIFHSSLGKTKQYIETLKASNLIINYLMFSKSYV
jgi:hypothetical protein